MYLHEMTNDEMGAYYSPQDDNTKLKLSDTRKSRLTLRHINKLRTMNELRAIETKQKLDKVRKQYGVPAGEEGGELAGL